MLLVLQLPRGAATGVRMPAITARRVSSDAVVAATSTFLSMVAAFAQLWTQPCTNVSLPTTAGGITKG